MADVHTLDIPAEHGGGWVKIRGKRSWGNSTRVGQAGIRIIVAGDGEAQEGRLDALARGLAIMETAVVEWSLPFKPDRSGFLSEDFDPDLGDWLVDAIEDHYTTRTTDEVKTDAAPSTES